MARLTLNKITTPATPPANYADFFYSSTLSPIALAAIDESSNILRIGGFSTKDFRLVKVTYITLFTTSYTPTPGVTALFVECIGAGAGGGGCATAVTNSAAAGGGGGGAYSAAWLTSLISGAHTVAVGAKGTGATAGANTGANGGDTSFKDTAGATVCLAKGGLGGAGDTVAAIHIGGLGGAGGAASGGTGDIKFDGTPGGSGLALAAAQCLSGYGAPGFLGSGGGKGNKNVTTSGVQANVCHGAGGGGASIISGGASQAGGDGYYGLIRVWEFA